MSVIVNPGSGPVPQSGEGWANTREGAVANAIEWWEKMAQDGLTPDLTAWMPEDLGDGRWRFEFRHVVTGVSVCLDTHGILHADLDAYMADTRAWAYPRIYWNGSSSGNPELADWAAPGFEPVCTYRAVEQ